MSLRMAEPPYCDLHWWLVINGSVTSRGVSGQRGTPETAPKPSDIDVAPQPATTPKDLMESECARMSSVSLLRRRAFEETSKIHEERETTMSQDLEAAQWSLQWARPHSQEACLELQAQASLEQQRASVV